MAIDGNIDDAFRRAAQHHLAGRLADAEKIYREILAKEPQHPQALQYLGAALLRMGRVDEAIDLIRRAVEINPHDLDAHGNLGNALRAKGDLDAAAAEYERAIQLQPASANAYFNLGNVCVDQRRFDLAITAFRRAIELKNDFAAAYFNLANALVEMHQFDEAARVLPVAIRLNPKNAEAHNLLGNALARIGDGDAAIQEYQHAIRLDPNAAPAHTNLGRILAENGEMAEAAVSFRRALDLAPDHAVIHSNLLYSLYFQPGWTGKKILEEHQLWARRHAAPFQSQIPPHRNDPDPQRRLRIGYVSPDFCIHPVGRFILPLLRAHDHARFEIFCYSSTVIPDDLTSRAKGYSDVWRDIRGLSDERATERVRDDRIDILIDLTMHMAGNRMLMFARRAAPVQATYLAYPGTTGLETMDYRISDIYLDPPASDESGYAERTVRLPVSYWCYEAPSPSPDVTPLPAASSGVITFASLNSFSKVSPLVVETWSKLLSAVQNSRLVLHAPTGSHRDRAHRRFAEHGIDAGRLSFVQRVPLFDYLSSYQSIDIALDPFPYVGGTTSCDALWMGVPVVTLAGELATGRGGVSILNNIGHAELIAKTPQEYIQIASRLAGDLDRLTQLRRTLREQLQASPLMDARRFGADMENAYRQLWQTWCARQTASI
jgi:protein O-GlcNAc transferase